MTRLVAMRWLSVALLWLCASIGSPARAQPPEGAGESPPPEAGEETLPEVLVRPSEEPAPSPVSSEGLGGPYDLVVSALSIHHLEDAAKLALFKKAYAALAPSGIFINADQVLGATPDVDMTYRQTWLAQVRAHGVTEAELNAALERMQDDKMATLEFQLDGLIAAGFANANCWYKRYSFVVYSAEKVES